MCIVSYMLSGVATQLCSLCSINRLVACINLPSGCVKLLWFSVLSLDILLFEVVDYLIPLHHNAFSSLHKIIFIVTLGLYVLTLKFQQFQIFAVMSLACLVIPNSPYSFLCQLLFHGCFYPVFHVFSVSIVGCLVKTNIFFSPWLRFFLFIAHHI